jgi:hypothetical protein
MHGSRWDRKAVEERARDAAPLDGIFMVTVYNERLRKDERIDIFAILTDIQECDLIEMQKKMHALESDEAYFGEKYWTGSRCLDYIIDEMKRLHPGFSPETYDYVLNSGIIKCR